MELRDQIVKAVNTTLNSIIESYGADAFKKQKSFKVRPGYGYNKFYLDHIEGTYDMSLQSLIHYILFEDGHYKKFLNSKQFEDLILVISNDPDMIYGPDRNDVNYQEIEYEYLDYIYSKCIGFVGSKLIDLGYKDLKKTFKDYI